MTAAEIKRKICYDENGAFNGQDSVIEAMQEYAREKCSEQRTLCGMSLSIRSEVFVYPKDFDKLNKIITNAPAPDFS
jgi:hypothetical protein